MEKKSRSKPPRCREKIIFVNVCGYADDDCIFKSAGVVAYEFNSKKRCLLKIKRYRCLILNNYGNNNNNNIIIIII